MRYMLHVVTEHRTVICSNVIATTISGDPAHTLLVGSHMDGVAAGPGINDNGSGTATNLASSCPPPPALPGLLPRARRCMCSTQSSQ